MPTTMLYKYTVLREFTYLKMVATEVLRSLNVRRVERGLPKVCQGVIDCETKKVQEARNVFESTDQSLEGKYIAFLDAFNKMHSYSMV